MVYFFLHVRLLGVFNPAVEEISGGHAEHFGDFFDSGTVGAAATNGGLYRAFVASDFFLRVPGLLFFLLRTVCVFF